MTGGVNGQLPTPGKTMGFSSQKGRDMKFKINGVSSCGGGNHITVQIQRLPAGRSWNVHFSKRDALSTDEDREKDREHVAVARVVSAVRESGFTTPSAIRAFLLNKEFEV